MPDEIHDVVIIGAGLAGLTAAHVLRDHGISAIILDREAEIGGSWQRRHPQLTLNTHRDLSTLPDFPYPAGTGAFPKRDAVVGHLRAFAARHAFEIRHGFNVRAITRLDRHFLIAGDAGEIRAVHVVVATGRDTDRRIPDWQGRDRFRGDIRHAADFGDRRDYAGKSILVVGGGNSGFDILNHLSRVKTGPVWLSVRRGPSVLPKRLLRLSVHRLSPLMQRLPTPLVDRLIAATQWLAFGNLSRMGFPPGSPDAASRLIRDHIAIPVDDGAIAAIRKGQVTVMGPVRAFGRDAVMLEDGREIVPDVVLVATGYDVSTASLMTDAPDPDRRYPGLWSIGMTPSLTSFFMETRREATSIAKAIHAARRPSG